MDYEIVIGLEVHAQLLTQTKMFCGCSTRFGAAPNSQVCPVCLGMPGTLPVTNRKAVEYAVKMGLAVHCEIRPDSIFARKSYFYPDLPKGYQISQYEMPICRNGWIEIGPDPDQEKKKIRIHRIHLEEDAGKSIHSESFVSETETLIDLNRCGTPLIEIVSEPDIRSPREAYLYLHKIRQLVRWLHICDGNMEEGSLRCDANLSLRRPGEKKLGVKTELKNMNTIRGVEKALTYEVGRQTQILNRGEKVNQETLLWDEAQGIAVSMRSKESDHDYRYFPDPDLIPILFDENWTDQIRMNLPELPDDRKTRWLNDFGLSPYDIQVLNEDKGISDYFEAVAEKVKDPKTAANWVMGEVLRVLNEEKIPIDALKARPDDLAGIIRLIREGTLSHTAGKTLFDHVAGTGENPESAARSLGLNQVSDESELEILIQNVISGHPDALKKYREGKQSLFGFFVGQVMQKSGGQANPKVVHDVLKKILDEMSRS